MRSRAIILFVLAGALVAPSASAQRNRKNPDANQNGVPDAQEQPPSAPPPSVRHQDQQEMNLAVGETRTIPAADVKNYSEGNPGVVDVKLTSDASQFVVVGQKPGSTSLLLIKKSGQEQNWVINVFTRSPQLVEKEVSDLLEGYTGVRLRRVGARFFIEGGVSTEGDLRASSRSRRSIPGRSSRSSRSAAPARTGRRTSASTSSSSSTTRTRATASASTGRARCGATSIQSNFGYDFVAKAATAQANIVNQPLPGLDIASEHGWAKVLKQATVITTNGVEANFDNGGEQNFPVAAGLTGTIQKIAFGTDVTVLPRFDPGTGDIRGEGRRRRERPRAAGDERDAAPRPAGRASVDARALEARAVARPVGHPHEERSSPR